MADAVRINGLRELRRGLRAMERSAPRELNKVIKETVGDVALPTADRETPVRSGALRSANRVTTRGDRVVMRNARPYANTIHWGRKKRGVVKGRPFFVRSLESNEQRIGEAVLDGVERFVDRNTPS